MLTDFFGVAVDYGKPTQRLLRRLTLEEVKNHLVHDGGRQVTICALEQAPAGLRGDTEAPLWRLMSPTGDRCGPLEAAVLDLSGTHIVVQSKRRFSCQP
jgi:hypothetical protein